MNEDITTAVTVIENTVRPTFEDAWQSVTERDVPQYRMLLWGSVIEDNKTPNDLDVIISYKTQPDISADKEASIRGIIQSKTHPKEYAGIDPLVAPSEDIPSIIANSRVSRVYSVDDNRFVELE